MLKKLPFLTVLTLPECRGTLEGLIIRRLVWVQQVLNICLLQLFWRWLGSLVYIEQDCCIDFRHGLFDGVLLRVLNRSCRNYLSRIIVISKLNGFSGRFVMRRNDLCCIIEIEIMRKWGFLHSHMEGISYQLSSITVINCLELRNIANDLSSIRIFPKTHLLMLNLWRINSG